MTAAAAIMSRTTAVREAASAAYTSGSAASSVGDDTLQKREQGMVVPDSFTHGSSAQRVKWFRRGFEAGTTNNCDTFGAGAAL